MSGKRNVSVCSGHDLANALYPFTRLKGPYSILIASIFINEARFSLIRRRVMAIGGGSVIFSGISPNQNNLLPVGGGVALDGRPA